MHHKKKILIPLFLFLFTNVLLAQHKFTYDLNDIADDLFKVTLVPDKLTKENDVFQFAATAPGTYSIMDIGRFVRSFTAMDSNGDTIATKQISTNQWKISDPEKTVKISYAIAETFDNPVDEHPVYNMCGTSLEKDHAYINNHAVLGYFHGMQSHEIWIKLEYPADWKVGTAMTLNDEGYFTAPTYDFAVDSPMLLGRLSESSVDVEGTKVDVFTYSKTDKILSDSILVDLKDILFAASKFTEGLPVERYVFLFHFEDLDFGAWEHSYSSGYALKESELNEQKVQMLRSVVAHEFFHVVTPLNIHSELVEKFNFETPELSRHLWLYEGATEWSAWIMQLRGGIMPLEVYLEECSDKLNVNDNFDPSISLTELGVRAAELEDQYINIYHGGAMTATLLDLLILKESKGKKGLREVIVELTKKYGPNKPFDEENFFNELVAMTYPSVDDYIKNYIDGTQELPVKEYFAEIGIDYQDFAGYDSSKVAFGISLNVNGAQQIFITQVSNSESPFMVGDIIKKVSGTELTLMNAQTELGKINQMKAGETVHFTVDRDGTEEEFDAPLLPQKIKHQFTVLEKPSKKQLKLRDKWLRNL